VSEAISELTGQEQQVLGDVGHRLEDHLPALTAGWERALDALLAAEGVKARKGLRQEGIASVYAMVRELAEGKPDAAWQTGRAYGDSMALKGLAHSFLGKWLTALRQSVLTMLSQLYANDPQLDLAIVAVSKFFAVYIFHVTESFSSRQQALLLEQQEALRQAYEEAQRRVVELEVLNEIGQAISSTMELEELLELIYQQTSRLMETTNFYIALCDEPRGEWLSALHVEQGERQVQGRHPLGVGLTGHIIRTREHILLRDVQENLAFKEKEGIQVIGEIATSWLGVPMIAQERVVGVIGVQSYEHEHAYDEGHLRILSTIASQAAVAVANARLYQEARRRAEEMGALYRIGAAAAGRLSLEETLQSVYEQAHVVMDTSTFFVALYDRQTDEISFPLDYEDGVRADTEKRKKGDGGGLTGWVLDHPEPLLIDDWEEAPAELRDIAVQVGGAPRSWLGVPLMVRGEAVGVIAAQSWTAHAFDEDRRQVLEMIAHQAAASIENARLYEEAQRRWREEETLLEVSQALGTMLDPQTLVPAILQMAIRVVPAAEKGSVFLRDPRTGELVIRAQQGYAPEVVDQVRLQPGEGFAGWVFQEQRSDLIQDTRQDPRFKEALSSTGIRSLIAAPLVSRSGVLGVISLDNGTRPGAFSAENLRVLDGLAQQVAVALENARLFSETRRRLDELEVLNEIGRAITSTMDLDALVELIYHQTSRLMDTTSYFMVLYEKEEEQLDFVLHIEAGERLERHRRALGTGLTGHIVRHKAPLHFPYGPDEFLKQQGITRIGQASKSWLGVPMTVQDRVVGAIAVQSYTHEGAYDEGHLRVLSTIAAQAAVAVENARLYQEARRRVEEMEALYRIGAASATHLSMEEVCQSIYEQAGVVMDTTAFYVALYDREQDEIVFALDYEEGERQEETRFKKSEHGGLTGWVLDQQQSLLIRNWEDAPVELRRIAVMVGEGDEPKSWLGVPMVVRGESIGVIAAQSWDEGVFDEHHQQVLEMIAHQAAAALSNARLYEEAQQRVAQLSALQQVGLKLAATADVTETLDAVVDSAMELFHPNDILIFLYDAQSDTFTLGTGLNEAGERGLFAPMPRKDGLSATVARAGQLMVVEDASQHPLYAQSQQQVRGLHSLISTPLLRAGEVLGVLNVSYYDPHHFTTDEIRLIQALADQAAVAVGNARLFQQMNAVMQELQETTDTQSELLKLVQDLSTPVVPLLRGVLLMPLVGSVDSARGAQILERLLQMVEQQNAQVVLVDITGVPVVDTGVAQILLQSVQAVRFLGGEAVLVGIRPEVAQTLVSLGVNLAGITTRADLQSGVVYAMRRVSQEEMRTRGRLKASSLEKKT
jgi:GAF domain-containing protein